jgi:predicted Zn-dependent protease
MALVVACATSPTGREQFMMMPESQMAAMGVQSFDEMKKQTPPDKDPAVNAYVQCVADAITQLPEVRKESTSWEVVVFDDKQVNAFALPGGKIGVYKGLLGVAKTPGQLAAVLGHEIGHVLAHHGNERISQQFAVGEALALIESWMAVKNTASRDTAMAVLGLGAQVGILLPYSRIHESEADRIGQDLMASAGFDPHESVALWQNMAKAAGGQPAEFLSTHPAHKTRIADLQAGLDGAMLIYQQAQAAGHKPECRQGKGRP